MSFRQYLSRLRHSLMAGGRACAAPRHRARRPRLEFLEDRTLLSVNLFGVPAWAAQGPAPQMNAGNTIGPTRATSLDVGAIEALAVDPANSRHLIAGAVNGGIWQTADFTVGSPTWSTTTDFLPSLSISSIAFSPANSNVIYAGTGGLSSLGINGRSVGVYKSITGGATWQVLDPTDAFNPNGIFTGLRILRIIPTTFNAGQTVFLATTNTGFDGIGSTTGGVYRSDDGGMSWARLSGANGLPNSGVTDLVQNPSNANQFFASISRTSSASAGVFRLDLGVSTTWVNVTNNIAAADLAASLRIELSVSSAVANPVWASIINTGGFYQRVYRGVVSGATINWAQVGPVSQPPDIFTGHQGGLHGAILADQSADNLVYLGGDTANTGFVAGYIVRGDSAANTWTALTPIGAPKDPGTVVPTSNGDTTAPHSDSRALLFASGGVLLCACDGGVYQGTKPSSTKAGDQTWTSINGTLQVTEFYNIAYDSQFHIIFGGAQDTGNPEQTGDGSFVYTDESGGDGGATAADPYTGAGIGQSVRYFFGAVRKVYNSATGRPAGDHDASILPMAGLAGFTSMNPNDLFTTSVVNAIRPTAAQLLAGQSTRVVVSGNPKMMTPGAVYESNDAGSASLMMIGSRYFVNDNWTQIPTGPGFVRTSVIAYGGRSGGVDNPDVLYAASGSRIFLRTTAGGTLNATAAQPAGAGNITAIALDPNDWRTAFVTDNVRVFMTTDAGAHWIAITGNLSSPGSTNAFLAVIAGTGVDAVLFGGTKGVFSMLTNAPGIWSKFGAGLPNTFVGGMVYNAADDVVVVGTIGRGAWKLASASTIAFATEGFSNSFALGSFVDTSLIGPWTVDVNWGDGTPDTTFGSAPGSLGTQSHTYGEEGTYTVTVTVTDTGTSESDSKSFQVVVADPAVVATGGFAVSAVEGANSGSQTVATFTDPGGAEPNASDPLGVHYTVSITWGDGTSSTGTITPGGGGVFTVQGSHTYGEEATYTITVTVHHENAPDSNSVTSTATVSDPAVVATGVDVSAKECIAFTLAVATFTDPGGAEPNPFDNIDGIPSHYTATTDWGDSTPVSTDTISYSGAPGSKTDPFTVTGTHTFAEEGTFTITTTINHEGIITVVKSTATVRDNFGLLVLDPSGDKALMVTGNGSVTVTNCGAVVVDSSDPRAIFLTGNATVTAAETDVTGDLVTHGHASLSGELNHEAATPDPLGLALLPAPATMFAAVHYSGSAPLTLAPGTYVGGIFINGSGPVTLLPGVYYMKGGGFMVTGQGSVTGSGVLIVNAPSGPSDTIKFAGQGAVTLSAPTGLTGALAPYNGIAIFQDPASDNPAMITGQASLTMTGVLYAPNALLKIDGHGNVVVSAFAPGTLSPGGEVIVFDAMVTGNGDLTINADPAVGGGASAPAGHGPLGGGQQADGNGLSSVSVTRWGESTTGTEQTVLDELFSSNSGGTGVALSGESKGAQPNRSIAPWTDPLSGQLVDELVSSLVGVT